MLRAYVDDKWVIKMTVFLHLRLKVGVPAEASGMHRFGEFVTAWFHPNSSHVDQGVHWRHWMAAFNAGPGLLRCTYGSLMTQEVRLASQTIVLRYTREHYLVEVNLRLLIRLLWETWLEMRFLPVAMAWWSRTAFHQDINALPAIWPSPAPGQVTLRC